MILFILRGGMKTLNPQLQVKALLAKPIPRGLLSAWALWKNLLNKNIKSNTSTFKEKEQLET